MTSLSVRRPTLASLGKGLDPWSVFLVGAFILSRIWYYRSGLRFDVSPLDSFLQYVDPALLRDELLQSVWNLHSQPPLFNLFLGTVLKLFPADYPSAFAAIYLGLGLILLLTIQALLLRTGVPSWLRAVIALCFSISPVAALYENWLFYAHPVAVLVGLSALFLQRYADRMRRVDLVAFFGLVTTLALTWAAFHLLWVVATGAVVMFTVRERVREIAAIAAVSLLIVGSIYTKNCILFGVFGCGSIYPKMNLALMTLRHLPDLKRHVENGDISETSLISPYRGKPDEYGLALGKPTGVGVLDEVRKPDGHSNWHNLAYLSIADQYYHDARWVLRTYPTIYLASVWENVKRYFVPATDSPPFRPQDGNAAVRMRAVAVVNALFTGRVGQQGVGWVLVFVLPISVGMGIMLLTRRGRVWLNVDEATSTPKRATIGFCVGTVIYLPCDGAGFCG
jgi:hypothetical protein